MNLNGCEKIKNFPRGPGVYLFKGAKGEVLYVGKAKNLRARIKSYFAKGRDERAQIEFLLRRTRDLDFIVTDTEKEALLLENTLIKEHRPRYNISLRDDKSYVSIRIGADHPFPGIALTRRIKKDGALYFGPYDSGPAAREAVENITRYFRLRTCVNTEFANRVRPCLKYDIGRCTAPCVGRVSEDDYAGQVEEARLFLKGKSAQLTRILDKKMMLASEKLQYEEAGRLRDVIGLLKGLVEGQNVVCHGRGDRDAVGVEKIGGKIAICVLNVRGGALIGKKLFFMDESPGGILKVLEEFLLGFYRAAEGIPSEILLPFKPESTKEIAALLSERRACKVKLCTPARGDMLSLVKLSRKNAREACLMRAGHGNAEAILERVGRKLKLSQAPELIECLDISNLQGSEAVGSVVSFVGGEPDKTKYRIYNIQTIATPDDYAMMKEILERRFGFNVDRALPDLLLVDGGKGQLAIARRVLDEAGLRVPIAAIAKGEKKGHADQIFVPGRKNPLSFKRGSKELLFLMKIRDEAHRFGIRAHRRRRSKKVIEA